MGIYFDHGVEYHVRTRKTDTRPAANLTLVTTAQSDGRLEASRYYAARKDAWFVVKNPRCDRITADDFDVELSSREERTLQQFLDKYGDAVEDHGWYDVVTMSTTYDHPGHSTASSSPRLEYCAELSDGKLITVVEHRDRFGNFLEPGFVEPGDVDLQPGLRLTGEQLALLESVLRVHDVVRHGWYNR